MTKFKLINTSNVKQVLLLKVPHNTIDKLTCRCLNAFIANKLKIDRENKRVEVFLRG